MIVTGGGPATASTYSRAAAAEAELLEGMLVLSKESGSLDGDLHYVGVVSSELRSRYSHTIQCRQSSALAGWTCALFPLCGLGEVVGVSYGGALPTLLLP